MDPKLYLKLMDIQKKILTELDESLAKHNIKLIEFEEDLSNKMVSLDEAQAEATEEEEEDTLDRSE